MSFLSPSVCLFLFTLASPSLQDIVQIENFKLADMTFAYKSRFVFSDLDSANKSALDNAIFTYHLNVSAHNTEEESSLFVVEGSSSVFDEFQSKLYTARGAGLMNNLEDMRHLF